MAVKGAVFAPPPCLYFNSIRTALAVTQNLGRSHKEKIEVFFLPPYAPEYNPDEYLNHALKISVHSGQLPYTAEDISHKIQSFMRRLQHHPSVVSSFFLRLPLSYLCL